MSTWQEKNAALLAELAETLNPSVRGNAIGCYLRDARKDHQLTVYEQYVLETEKLSYERLAWTQSGWSRRAVRYYIKEEIELWQSSAST